MLMQPIIDFLELEARGEPGEEFEQLMRALFEAKGLQVTFSGRGPDEGRDLLVEESLHGAITGTEKQKWLVWCRNKARSNRAVAESELPSISDKCTQHRVDGFLLASTTFLSSGAQKMLDELKGNPQKRFAIKYYVRYDIEQMILENEDIFRRFFPESYRRYRETQAKFTITEPDLQRAFMEVYGEPLEPTVLRRLLSETLQLGISDIEQVRQILQDAAIHQTLEEIYHSLLGRGLDPSGHFTWGYRLKQYGHEGGRQLVENGIMQSREFVDRPGVSLHQDFGEGPRCIFIFDKPGNAIGWQVYRVENSRGRIERTFDRGSRFLRISSEDKHGIRARFPDDREFGFRKRNCNLTCRYTGLIQIFFGFRDVAGNLRWLVYQTGNTSTSAADRRNPAYAVKALDLKPGADWVTVDFALANDHLDSFGADFRAISKVSFHVEGTLDIHRISFTSPAEEELGA
jgi:hypothetical protein